MVASVAGMVLMIGISVVFEYVSVYNGLSFALKNGIYQSAKIAVIPEIVCELIENPQFSQDGEEQEEVEEYIEMCEEIYLTEEEYYDLLSEHVRAYKHGGYPAKLSMMAYQSVPFLARATLNTSIHSSFLQVDVEVDEMVIQNEK